MRYDVRTLHLFAGAGGGLLADLILGHEPVCAVEWDAYCCQVLRERTAEGWFPNLQVFEGDVRMFPASDWKGRVDCIHAGFPCQDISIAGKRAGVDEGTRSGLYREVLRCADEIRPKFLFLENVSAILSNGLGTVLGDLAARGYDCRWCCLRASDVGAPHQRDRWWCLAYAVSPGKWWDTRESQVKENDLPAGESTRLTPRTYKESKRETERSKGFKSWGIYHENRGWWTVEPHLGRVAHGVASRVDRLKALGNGQVALQAALAWTLLNG